VSFTLDPRSQSGIVVLAGDATVQGFLPVALFRSNKAAIGGIQFCTIYHFMCIILLLVVDAAIQLNWYIYSVQ
jgi:hypothetical protein